MKSSIDVEDFTCVYESFVSKKLNVRLYKIITISKKWDCSLVG